MRFIKTEVELHMRHCDRVDIVDQMIWDLGTAIDWVLGSETTEP